MGGSLEKAFAVTIPKKPAAENGGGGAGEIPLDFPKSMWKNNSVLDIGGWKGAGGFFYEF